MLYGIVFLFGWFKKARYLHRYPENNLFTLKKLIPIENLKRGLCEKDPFFLSLLK